MGMSRRSHEVNKQRAEEWAKLSDEEKAAQEEAKGWTLLWIAIGFLAVGLVMTLLSVFFK